MSKTSGMSSSAAKSVPSPPAKTSGASDSKANKKESPPNAKSDKAAENKPPVEAHKSTPPGDKHEQAKLDPPSTDTHKFSDSSDSFSLSRESTGRMSTEGTTRLVDKLVDAYTGEHSCFSSSSSGNSSRESSRGEHDCSFSPGRTRRQLKNLDEAGAQIGKAQERVEQVLEKAVDAKIYNKTELPEKDVQRAEQEQESLTKAEGRLHRTKGALFAKQESSRQERANAGLQRTSAEHALLKKFETASPLLKQHLLAKFRPLINRDARTRDDHQQLHEAAEQHIKSDPEAARLAQEHKVGEEQPGAQAQKRLLQRLESPQFKEQIRQTEFAKRAGLVQEELETVKDLPAAERREFETHLNNQLSESQVEEANTTNPTSLGKDEEKKQKVLGTLLKAKENQTGGTGQALESTTKAVGRIDEDSVRRTATTLEHLDLDSVHSTLDLSRKFGRGVSEVRSDLEQQVARGGPAESKARQTLGSLDRIIGRTKLLSQADGWAALEQSLHPEGPYLNRFLGLPDGHFAGDASLRAPRPFSQSVRGRDLTSANTIVKRLARSGSRIDDNYKYETLRRLRKFGT